MPSIPTVPQQRNQLRPVKYHIADTFWCTYIISVISANIAELGTFTTITNTIHQTDAYHQQKVTMLGLCSIQLATCFVKWKITDQHISLFSVTYPLDLAKTRLQIQGEKSATGSKAQVNKQLTHAVENKCV